MHRLKQAGLIIGASALLAIIVALTHPKRPTPPWLDSPTGYGVTFESIGDLDTVLWVDARNDEAFETGHAPGAIHLNEDNWEEAFFRLIEAWNPAQMIIVYCDASDCHSSEAVAQRLRQDLNSESVFFLEGGWESLKAFLL